MQPPYAITSDQHAHEWTAFASLDAEGRNTRLMATIHELDRCCRVVLDAGGDLVVFGGDLMHVRNAVSPAVFNPLRDCLTAWRGRGVRFVGIPGNHDLGGRDSRALTSAVQMLHDGDACRFHHETATDGKLGLAFIPWQPDVRAFWSAAERLAGEGGGMDLICHVGIDGTLSNMPDHGVTADRLADLGFRRVFSGHYHNHRDFGRGVWSIGASTMQTWSDVGTKAGFLLVYPDRVEFRASHAPSFIDLTGEEDPAEVPLLADGNFVRARIGTASVAQVAEMRQALLDAGAKGVVIQAIPESTASRRSGVSVKSLAALDKSVTDYVSERGMAPEVATICAEILGEVRA